MGDCMHTHKEKCFEIQRYITCIDTCEFEIKPYEMSPE